MQCQQTNRYKQKKRNINNNNIVQKLFNREHPFKQKVNLKYNLSFQNKLATIIFI